MKRANSPFYARRTFILSLLLFVAVAALVSFGVSARRANRAAALRSINSMAGSLAQPAINVQDKNPNVPNAATMTATLDDNVAVGTKVPSGGTINYTAVVSNTAVPAGGGANDAGSVTYSATLDANTTISGAVQVSPVTRNDTYPNTVIGNVSINSDGVFNVLTNDYMGQNPAGTITGFSALSAQNGNVVVDGDGTFTYNPPAGYEGADSFTYTLSNAAGSSIGTVNLTVSGMVWFINNNSAACTTIAAGCGRISNPFSDLGSFNTVNNGGAGSTNPAINDNVFIYESATAYNNSITLLNGQRLIGQDSTSSLSTLTGLTPPSGSSSFPAMNSGNGTITKITSGTGNGITLNTAGGAGSNTVNGLTVGNTTGAGISGTNFGALTAADVSIFEPSAARTGQALTLSTGALNVVFGTVSSSSSGTTNVALLSVTGSINLGTGALSGATSNAFTVTGAGNTANISYAGTITNSTGRAVNVQSKTGGTVTISGLVTSTGTGIFLDVNTGATINFTGGISASTGANPAFTATGGGTVSVTDPNAAGTAPDNTLTTTSGTALNVANTTIGASGLTFRSITAGTAAGSAGNGITLDTTGSSGGLNVTGTGAANSGGIIQNKTGADSSGVTPGGTGIVLNNTRDVVLNDMHLHDFSNYAIRGNSVTNFSLDDSTIDGVNGGSTAASAGSPFNDSSISFDGLTGTATISDTSISGGWSNNFRLVNGRGTLGLTFQGLVDGLYRASFGRRPSYGEFRPDAAAVAPALVVGADGWATRLENGKTAFVDAFVQRAAFQTAYAGLSNQAYVDALIANTGTTFTTAERDALVSSLGGGMTRAAVLRTIVENPNVVAAKRNEAFVMMEYFGYLRREPDAGGYQFWLDKLIQFNGNFEQAEMVKAFIVSGEYRDRFPR